MDYKTLLIERVEPVLKVTFNRPNKLNAMNNELITEMFHLFGELRADLGLINRVIRSLKEVTG